MKSAAVFLCLALVLAAVGNCESFYEPLTSALHAIYDALTQYKQCSRCSPTFVDHSPLAAANATFLDHLHKKEVALPPVLPAVKAAVPAVEVSGARKMMAPPAVEKPVVEKPAVLEKIAAVVPPTTLPAALPTALPAALPAKPYMP